MHSRREHKSLPQSPEKIVAVLLSLGLGLHAHIPFPNPVVNEFLQCHSVDYKLTCNLATSRFVLQLLDCFSFARSSFRPRRCV